MSSTYKDYSKKQYKQIPDGELVDGDVFICRTVDYDNPFEQWDFAVVKMLDDRPEIFGKFKDFCFAEKFANSI